MLHVKKVPLFSPTLDLSFTDIEVSDSEAMEILNLAAKAGALERPNGTHTTVVGGMCCVNFYFAIIRIVYFHVMHINGVCSF